jgi:cupin fold WbuC family metalloprotein
MRTRSVSNEVFYADERIVKITREDLARLIPEAARNERRRMRLCAHRSVDDPLHEMLIVLARDTYVRPHKHLHKSESFHVVEGEADIVVFEEDGSIRDVIPMGEYSSGACFYYRLADPCYHGLVVHSEVFVYHETTGGPLDPAQTVLAPWAPAEDALTLRAAFLARLIENTKTRRRDSL